jgi:opacity protein-like surface antigen
MKNIKLSIIALMSTMNFIYAGGDISPVTPYEITDIEDANLEAVEVVKKEEKKPIVVVPSKQKENIVTPKEPIKENTSSNSGAYIGIGGTVARYDTNCDCATSGKSGVDKTGGITAKAGYNINRYIGIEARGVSTTIKDNGAKVTHYGAYIKPMLPITKKLKTYALVGYGKSKTTGNLRKSDVNGLAWGVGVDYDINKNISAFIDYQKLINKSDSNAPKLDTLSVGANYNF